MQAAAISTLSSKILYNEQGTYTWLWNQAPWFWNGHVDLQFTDLPLSWLKPSGCWIDPAIVARHLSNLRNQRSLAPLVVCDDSAGAWYIHDGNHRYHALRQFFAGNDQAYVRVAIAIPKNGFHFVYRWFATYGTFVLQPSSPPLKTAMGRRTLVLVAHQDDETVCAGLLQRLSDSIVAFATNGAPADAYFWGRFGSRWNYAAVRRAEAEVAVRKLGVSRVEFLNDYAPLPLEFRDQALHRVLPLAFQAVCGLVRQYRPNTVLVPAYEGGHPDHDSCSFIGALVGQQFGLPVWEMPLYHRSQAGELKCQQFLIPNGTERAVILSVVEKQVREHAIATYASQTDIRDFVSTGVELFRPQAKYDYSRPPHRAVVNYETWQWPITAEEVCRAFTNCSGTVKSAERGCYAQCSAPEQKQSEVSAGA
jgi:LmbE family N-acetylglucosaminyl deacetylase